MRAIIDNYDHIASLRIKGGINVGPVPGGVGLHRLRWTGSALVDLADLTTIHVRRSDGRWWFHAMEVPGSQPVAMTFVERKRIIDDGGTFRILDAAEWTAKLAADEADVQDNRGLKAQLIDLIKNTSFAELETKVNAIFADHTGAQRKFILQLSRIVLYLAKKELK